MILSILFVFWGCLLPEWHIMGEMPIKMIAFINLSVLFCFNRGKYPIHTYKILTHAYFIRIF